MPHIESFHARKRQRSLLPGALLAIVVSASLPAFQTKPIAALTGDAELIETHARASIAMTEADYQEMAKQLAQMPSFVPMTKKPEGLSPRARFGINFILEHRNLTWILDGDDAGGYLFYADINANGDLSDDPPRRFDLVDGKYSLRFQLLAKAKDAVEAYPVIMKLVIGHEAWPGKTDKQLALLIHDRSRRSGELVIQSGEPSLPFNIFGFAGVYNDADCWVFFDLNHDGTFDSETEGYRISEKYVNIGDITYEFAVHRNGRNVTLTPLPERRSARAVLRPGYSAPDFAFVDLQGHPRKLSDYRGKVVLLDFWGTWCAGCVSSVPQLAAVYEKYGAKGFEILGIAAEDAREKVTAFAAGKRMHWPQTIERNRGPIATLYRVTGRPSYFLVGVDGKIIVAAPGGGVEVDIIAGELAKLFGEYK